jgi:FtsP/CotA-like multicopper oxidase with cupredoxin domain
MDRRGGGVPVNEPFLRDSTFVYHCHVLEHEDGGMMGTIRVDPRD